MDERYTKDEYLEMVHDFKSSFPKPVVQDHDGIRVVREDLLSVGSKARAGEALIAKCESDRIVYVQPRFGFAGVSLTELCKKYDKKLTLFMPSSKEVSEHQAYCIENGCEYHFFRIAAMPNLNKIAKSYAEKTGSFFIPLGLRHPLVTAMIIKTAVEISKRAKIWSNMMDEDGNVNSNYGYQWKRSDQLEKAIKILKENPETRKASISLYDGKEIDKYSKDTVCTYAINFYKDQNGNLSMQVMMRSNDLFFGFCNDQYCFSKLQEMVSNRLGWPIGNYYHFACNMHIYERHFNAKHGYKF
jgi:hypothetical protein